MSRVNLLKFPCYSARYPFRYEVSLAFTAISSQRGAESGCGWEREKVGEIVVEYVCRRELPWDGSTVEIQHRNAWRHHTEPRLFGCRLLFCGCPSLWLPLLPSPNLSVPLWNSLLTVVKCTILTVQFSNY